MIGSCNMYKIVLALVLGLSTATATVTPVAVEAYSQRQLNSDRELVRLIQQAIRDEIASVNDQIRDLRRDYRNASTFAERRAINNQIRPLRSEARRQANRLRRSRGWSRGVIRFWAKVYLPSDVSPA